jgi:hypothetical protein
MKPQEKATELMEKFGSNALNVLEETFIVWNIKRNHELEKLDNGNRVENGLRALEICDRTLNYWRNVKKILLNKHKSN